MKLNVEFPVSKCFLAHDFTDATLENQCEARAQPWAQIAEVALIYGDAAACGHLGPFPTSLTEPSTPDTPTAVIMSQ